MSVDYQFAKAVMALLADRKQAIDTTQDITLPTTDGGTLFIPAAFLDGWITEEAERDHLERGSTICPVCGLSEPHTHPKYKSKDEAHALVCQLAGLQGMDAMVDLIHAFLLNRDRRKNPDAPKAVSDLPSVVLRNCSTIKSFIGDRPEGFKGMVKVVKAIDNMETAATKAKG